ncbi:MAG: histidine phosphatase family protein [Victivallales bacterium]|nr:histidine phosphatase family protein [Victivallales bacterium]
MAHFLTLIRHGELPEPFRHRYIGHTDAPLSPEGLEQAKRLANTPCDILFSSPLLRARQTAAAIRNDFHLDPRLAELDFGDWDNLTYDEIASRTTPERLHAWFDDPDHFAFPNGETVLQFNERTEAVFAELCNRPEEHVVAVTHGGVLMHLLSRLRGLPSRDMFQCLPPRGSATILRNENGLWKE